MYYENCQDYKANSKSKLIGTDHNYILFPSCLLKFLRISESEVHLWIAAWRNKTFDLELWGLK